VLLLFFLKTFSTTRVSVILSPQPLVQVMPMKFISRFLLIALVMLALLLAPLACDNDDDDDNDDVATDDDFSLGYDPPDDDAADDDDYWHGDDNQIEPGTQYPIVLMHGFFGWGAIGSLEYFNGVATDLEKRGYEVFTTVCSPINSMQVRAECAAAQIQAEYPGQRVNIISHSQGGLDARYIISTLGWGDRVAALVTVSTPHYGSAIADIIVGIIPGFAEPIVDWLMNLFGTDWDGFVQLTHDYVENEFNPANPDDPGVTYYSIQADAEENRIFLLDLSHFLIKIFDGPNDGIVPVESARYGIELETLSTDHWAIIGQPAGLTDFDYLGLYRDIALMLKEDGF